MSTEAYEALIAQQEAVELYAEHYRQADNGWMPSPGFGKVSYQDVCVAKERAANLRYKVLGINPEWKPKRPDLAHPFTTGRKAPINPAYFWIVQRKTITVPEHQALDVHG